MCSRPLLYKDGVSGDAFFLVPSGKPLESSRVWNSISQFASATGSKLTTSLTPTAIRKAIVTAVYEKPDVIEREKDQLAGMMCHRKE